MNIRRLGRRAKNQGQAGPTDWDASSPPPSGGLHFRSELHTAGELVGQPPPAPAPLAEGQAPGATAAA